MEDRVLYKQRRAVRISTVARLVGVTPRAIRYWVETGQVQAHRRGPRLWFIFLEDVNALTGGEEDPSAGTRQVGKHRKTPITGLSSD
jgi:hypothetical protein